MQASGSEDEIVQGINVTPLVDITLVLLIIFMVTATFVTQQGLKVTLPKASTVEHPPTPALTVTMAKDGRMTLMKQPVDLASLKLHVANEVSLDPNVRVLIKADKDLTYGQVAAVLDAVKDAGVRRCALAMERR